jgi:hypothetical protein
MDIPTAKAELIRRTLDWSTHDFARETVADFPILETYGLNNRYVLAFVYWFRALDEAAQETFKRVLPELAISSGLSLLGELMSKEAQKQLKEMVCNGVDVARNNLPPLLTADANAPSFVAIDKHKMLAYIEKHLTPIFEKPKSKRGLTLKYVNRYGDWSIFTKISLGSRWASEVRYEFTVQRKDYAKSGLQAISDFRPFWRRTLIGLWGITNSEWWSIPSQQDMEPVTKSLVEVSRHFMNGFPPLLTGLNCDD